MAALTVLSVGVARAEEGLEGEGTPVGFVPTPQAPPLLLAQALPGMAIHPMLNPVQNLPGMSGPHAAALPQPVITDVTNYPNPFDSRKAGLEGETVIAYSLAKDAKVSIEIYDLLGHKVRGWDLAAGTNGGHQGANTLNWDGTNGAGQKVSKGGYLAQIVIQTPETTATVIRKIGVIH